MSHKHGVYISLTTAPRLCAGHSARCGASLLEWVFFTGFMQHTHRLGVFFFWIWQLITEWHAFKRRFMVQHV
jgi:hypothetical protein